MTIRIKEAGEVQPKNLANLHIVQKNVRSIGGSSKKPESWIFWLGRNQGDIDFLIDTRLSEDLKVI